MKYTRTIPGVHYNYNNIPGKYYSHQYRFSKRESLLSSVIHIWLLSKKLMFFLDGGGETPPTPRQSQVTGRKNPPVKAKWQVIHILHITYIYTTRCMIYVYERERETQLLAIPGWHLRKKIAELAGGPWWSVGVRIGCMRFI